MKWIFFKFRIRGIQSFLLVTVTQAFVWLTVLKYGTEFSGLSYKHFTSVNYNRRVIILAIF